MAFLWLEKKAVLTREKIKIIFLKLDKKGCLEQLLR